MIGITQPRRVAAMSMAARVSRELCHPDSKVAYQIRYDTTVAPTTAIKFMTDGVLLRELATDFTLSKYSVIIVDEAHERSVNTDILIGVLSRVVKLRSELWKEGKEGLKVNDTLTSFYVLLTGIFASYQAASSYHHVGDIACCRLRRKSVSLPDPSSSHQHRCPPASRYDPLFAPHLSGLCL